MSYSNIADQKSMFFDHVRNAHYENAIIELVTPDTVAMDLGAGLGIHGFMALEAGAKRVYMVEPTQTIEVVKEIVRNNQYEQQVKCMRGTIETVDLPEKVDLIISVFTGNFLLSEDLLPSLFYARDNFMKEGGKLIPDKASMHVVPVSSPTFYEQKVDCWNYTLHNTNFGAVRSYAANSLYSIKSEHIDDITWLADEQVLHEMNFYEAQDASCDSSVDITIIENALCHGMLGWFNAQAGQEWFSTSPKEPSMHWSQVFLPLKTPLSLKKGSSINFKINRPEFGHWTWTITMNGESQRMSTFLSKAILPGHLLKASDHFKGTLSEKGKASIEALHMLDGQHSVSDIRDNILRKHPSVFRNHLEATNFLKKLIKNFSI